jgi:hypothetical protein
MIVDVQIFSSFQDVVISVQYSDVMLPVEIVHEFISLETIVIVYLLSVPENCAVYVSHVVTVDISGSQLLLNVYVY